MKNTNMLSQENREALIAAHPLFSLLTPADTKELASWMYEMTIPAGTNIVSEGEIVDSLYIIADGTAEVTRHSISSMKNEDTIIAKLSKGEAIGISTSAFFSKTGIRTATVTASSEMILLGIGLLNFNRFMQHPERLYPGLQKNSAMMLRMNLIKSAEPFAELTPEEIHKLVQEIEETSFSAGDYIFHQGEVGDTCYLIQEGEVEILIKNANDVEQVLIVLPTLSIFGEGAILTLNQRNASARAKTACKLLTLKRDVFLNVLHRDIFLDVEKEDAKITRSIDKMLKKNIHPKHFQHISVTEDKSPDGETIVTLKNSKLNTYFQLSREGWFVWQLLDGHHSTQAIFENYKKVFNKDENHKIITLLLSLAKAQFIHIPMIELKEKQTGRRSIKEAISSFFGLSGK